VNVNAVTANTNNVVQDYALVLSTGDGDTLTNALSVAPATPLVSRNPVSGLTVLPNGLPLFGQRVGGNAPYAATTNGYTNQWNFYIYTNTTTNLNVAFVTFFRRSWGCRGWDARAGQPGQRQPGGGGRGPVCVRQPGADQPGSPRDGRRRPVGDADGDREGALHQFSCGPGVLRGGAFAGPGGAEYAFVGVATAQPFGTRDGNGNIPLTVLASFPVAIPDGSPALPGFVTILALTTESDAVRKVVVTNVVTHQNYGDVIGR